MTEKPTLHDLTKDLAAASQRLKELELRENACRADTTNQRNEVNKMQKQFDEAVAEVKKQAHRETDWGRNRDSANAVRVG